MAGQRVPRRGRLLRRVRVRHHRGPPARAGPDRADADASVLRPPGAPHPPPGVPRPGPHGGRVGLGLLGPSAGRDPDRCAVGRPVRGELALRGGGQRLLLAGPHAVAGPALLVARRRGAVLPRVAVAVGSGVVVVGSLLWAAAETGTDATTAYYSTVTRAWELGLGAALAGLP